MPDALPPAKQVPAAYVDFTLNAIGYTALSTTASSRRAPHVRNRRGEVLRRYQR